MNKNVEDRALISFKSVLILSYDVEATQQVILPLETTLSIDIFIEYMVLVGDRFLDKMIFRLYEDKTISVNVEIDADTIPDFASASISTNQVSVNISQELTRAKEPIILNVTVNENAPAFIDFPIKIEASVPEFIGRFGFTKIKGATASSEVSLSPGFNGQISISEPEGNYIEIGPADTADFPIKITNKGNAPTLVNFEVLNNPEDWSVNIQESLMLPFSFEGEESSGTVVLRLKPKPPSVFEYQNERQTVQVKITSSYYRDPNLSGPSYTLNFTVDLKGDFGKFIALIIVIFTIIIIVVFLIVYKFYKSIYKSKLK